MSANPLASPAASDVARRQVGGIVGAHVDTFTLSRFREALGGDDLLLVGPARHAPAHGAGIPLVAEWDACYIGGSPLVESRQWEHVIEKRRFADVDGAFALAWVDGDGLHLVRDRVGERSLLYARAGDGLAFASTIHPLLRLGLPSATLSLDAVAAYLSFGYLPGRETLVDGVYELAPGEHVLFRDGEVTSELYWRLPPEEVPPRNEDEYRASLRALLEAAVTRRLPPAGPVAATLSGGIDSSLVAGLVAARLDVPLATYSLSFGGKHPNELGYATLMAKRCRSEHHVVELSAGVVMERFDETLASLSKPIGEPLTVANKILFEAAASQARIVFNGEGGDPLFGGPKNVPMIMNELYGPALAREDAYLLAHRKCFGEIESALAPEVATAAGDRLRRMLTPHLEDQRWTSLVNRLMALNVTFKGGHHILPKVDHLSRAHNVLPRSPLFDAAVVELAAQMPAALKLRGTAEKYILKLAVQDVVPREIVGRRKSGMRVPVETWLAGRFERFSRERLLEGLAPRGLLQRRYLEDLARPGEHPPPRRGAKVWLLLSLEAWLRTVFDGR